MQKRVALARAIALQPKYIIYDEPTSGLDPETSNRIDELINTLTDHLNVTSIVITHDMHSVLSIADRVAFIHQGKIHWTGTIDELHTSDDDVLLEFVRANEYRIGSHDVAPVDS
jgi:phospholipid/cholesterol/gamma-HCH transport system ATP-binding protein